MPALVACAALALTVSLAACHDKIPVASDSADSVIVIELDPDSGSVASQTFRQRRPKENFHYGVTEQEGYPRLISISYAVATRGAAWDGVSLGVTCIGDSLWLNIGNLPWQEQNRGTLLITLDDQPPLAEDLYLGRTNIHHVDHIEKTSSAELDEDLWYDRLRSAKTLTIGLLDSDLEPATFDLTRFFGTPFQEEIDNCAESSVSVKRR